MTANIPSCVVISVTSKEPTEIIKLILDAESLTEPVFLEEGISAYPWHINTKYYTADIHLCSLSKKTIGSKEFAQSVGATVIHFDSEKVNCLETVESWLPFIKEFAPEVQILLCDRCPDTTSEGVGRVNVQRWCVENKFEMVELNPEPNSEDEEEEEEALAGLAVTTGVRRVIQALHAHLWPNMIMKERTQHLSPAMLGLLNGSASDSGTNEIGTTNGFASHSQNEGGSTDYDSMMHRIDALLLGSDDATGENVSVEGGPEADFGSLLSRLSGLRAEVASMPNEQRLAVAEQVVMDFWKAIGGPEDELLDLGDMELGAGDVAADHN